MKALIVEDEPLARQLIAKYLSVEKQISTILEASNGFDAVRIINEEHPDIVFLDVELPKLNGMEVLELIDFQPAIIFTTAYDHYAISAFEKNAVDYLLKPFSEDRFRQALGKVLNNEVTGINDLKNEMPGIIERVVVRTGNKIKVIYIDEIKYLEAQDDYVNIVIEGEHHLKHQTMKFFEKHLPEKDFIRVHRSYIVNANCIDQIENYEKDQYLITIKEKNSQKIPVSKTGYNKLRNALNF